MQLLVLAAIIGVPVSALAYGFLKLVDELQSAFFTSLPKDLGFDAAPAWWPLPLLVVAGVLVALAIQRLPGIGGHSPADGFHAGGVTAPIELPGILFAALGTLSFGVVLGPEAPLILMGSGLGALAVRLAARDAPPTATTVIAAAGSFAAIAALFGSPLLSAFLMLEAAGIGGPMLGLVLLPGLLAAGIGELVFVGLDSLTGFGTFSLAIPNLPAFGHPTGAMFLWAIVFGVVAAFLGRGIQWLARAVRPHVEPRMVLLMPVLGALIAGLAIGFGRGHGQELLRGPVLGAVGAARAGRAVRGVVGRRSAAARPLQEPRLRSVAVELPWRTRLPGAVHRRGGRHGRRGPSRPLAGARRRHGHRSDVRRDAGPPADLDAARDGVARHGRPERHAGRDRRGRRGPRGVRAAWPCARAGGAGDRARRDAAADRSPAAA